MTDPVVGVAAAGVAFLVSVVVTYLVFRVTRRWELLDRPNERSSHLVPTPTGGGLGIIAGVWCGAGILALSGSGGGLLLGEGLAAWGAGTLVLMVLLTDDLVRPLRVTEKAVLLAVATIAWLALGPRLQVVSLPGTGPIELGAWSWIVTALWLLAVSNAFNFMDGIDGITSVQTLCVTGFLLLFLWRLGTAWGEAGILLAGTAGFLLFNRPPARIFMGDVGSTFLGFTLAAFGVLAVKAGLPFWLLLLFLGYYGVDTGYTLVRRAWRGENPLRAHRQHLYQRLNRFGCSPGQIDLWVLAVNLVLGAGGFLWVFESRFWGVVLVAAGGLLLLLEVIWVERRDPDLA
jgi:UDP-N-acetylmuramyl pentapeptide phosphotransferase/UDP-N-acetylglucosamine-1-phosphate transferase